MVLRTFHFFVLIASASAAVCSAQTPKALDLAPVKAAVECSQIAKADLARLIGSPATVSSASVLDASAGSEPYCRVQAVVGATGRMELRLPVSSWNQRFLAGGGPGGGSSPAGFATMSRQDIGNRGNEDAFATDYQARIDFAYRIMHLQVVAARALIRSYYGQPARFSYYNACSEPGREGMMEVQRFPDDFDGAVTGCPPINDTINNGLFYAWNIVTNIAPDGQLVLTPDVLPLLHRTVLEECDAADGLKDGLISDPLGCHPRLTEAECTQGAAAGTCLTPAQIHAALELYRGAHDTNGGKLTPTGVLPGSELQWTAVIAPPPPTPGRPMFANDRDGTVKALRSEFSDPPLGTQWTLKDLRFDRASFDAFTKLHSLYDATDPDLSAFAKAGHKLILFQGLADTNVLPAHAILYYTALQQTMGKQKVESFVRLYLMPGVGHCGGGDGPAIRDFLTPLQAWVEQGIAPGALQASHIPGRAGGMGPMSGGMGPGEPNGAMGSGRGGGMRGPDALAPPAKADLTRPIYPYPYTQRYVGTGDTKDASSFEKGPARPAPASLFTWWGSDFYKPDYEEWCTATGSTAMTCTAKP